MDRRPIHVRAEPLLQSEAFSYCETSRPAGSRVKVIAAVTRSGLTRFVRELTWAGLTGPSALVCPRVAAPWLARACGWGLRKRGIPGAMAVAVDH